MWIDVNPTTLLEFETLPGLERSTTFLALYKISNDFIYNNEFHVISA
jgi:hypothetical protein